MAARYCRKSWTFPVAGNPFSRVTFDRRVMDIPRHSGLDDLESLQNLGKGSFGVVKLVRERRSSRVLAMKVIRKSDMLRSCQEGHLRAERDFLAAASKSEWIVPLIKSFQDNSNLYLLMEYMPGGDFLGLLIRENTLGEARTQFYIAEMVVCIEEAHKLGCIHRDVKPDNFLIGADGHLKISDFGLAFDDHWSHDTSYYKWHRQSLLIAKGIHITGDEEDQKSTPESDEQRRHSLQASSSKHEPPAEVVRSPKPLKSWSRSRRSSLDRADFPTVENLLDWRTAASSRSGRQYTKQNIINHNTTLEFPAQGPPVSAQCQDLIKLLLRDKENRLSSPEYYEQDQRLRLGVLHPPRQFVFKDGASDIKRHPWFRHVPWDGLRRMQPQWIPEIDDSYDTHYFEEDEPVSDWSESVASVAAERPVDAKVVVTELQYLGYGNHMIGFCLGLIDKPYDSARLKKIDREIDGQSRLSSEAKQCMKEVVRKYGEKERKRPRDKLLRDAETKQEVLQFRKQTAFLGYSWRTPPAVKYPLEPMHTASNYGAVVRDMVPYEMISQNGGLTNAW
ncbi:Serine/threonine-protein kinase cbk1 [Colletotrichum trifolii]|uniref:non-specific serine/threonine protein kinase n=1 Tax=Colletotrichum trifolii TaxID=5466 RepID=A0A4R8RGD8_COLTR|nr:Serine/threonine-protein kinase cbk1 [Colletotrichum trifolii]